MCVQKAERRVCNLCDARNFDEERCRASGLFLAGGDEERIDPGSGHGRVGEIGLEELCLDVLDELVKVTAWIEALVGREPVRAICKPFLRDVLAGRRGDGGGLTWSMAGFW